MKMEIKLKEISIQKIVNYTKHLEECQGYIDDEEHGVYGMDGRLNIRPSYQREFIYKDKQRNAVIVSIQKEFPLGLLYWVENKDGSYEVLDGQQRLISICQYVSRRFAIKDIGFDNLSEEQQKQILDFKLKVYFCKGKDKDKLDWFKTINIVGEKLSEQELRNAIYTGTFINDAKGYFSKRGCPTYQIARNLLTGNTLRQDYLETAIKWISNNKIEKYMSEHQHDENAKDLWNYFEKVINWIKYIFPEENYRKEMRGIEFGLFYNKYKDDKYNPDEIEEEVSCMMEDEDVTKKPGIYKYIFTRNEKYLNIRSFTDKNIREIYEQQNGICVKCQGYFAINKMEADHITPWSKGGKTILKNCQMLCQHCNRTKSSK